MIKSNKEWLKQMGIEYRKPVNVPARPGSKPDKLVITHEGKPKGRLDDEVSPKWYEIQRHLFDESTTHVLNFCVLGGTDSGRMLLGEQAKHLMVFEPDIQSFMASLENINWPRLMSHQKERGGSMFIQIGGIDGNVRERICQHLYHIGLFQSATMHYRHDGTEAGVRAIHAVSDCLQLAINTLGFYDDERVGLAHTIHRLESRARFLAKPAEPYIDKPVVVCGNGPSLLKSLPEITAKREQIYLVSCGSTIGTMFNHGIKPDFHIEQERPKSSSNWTALRTTPDYRDGITLIGLHVVHPQADDLFKDAAYAIKGNDAGGELIAQFVSGVPVLALVLPQVGNAGTAIMSELGFKNIYLAGIDCAYSEDGAAHPAWYPEVWELESDCTLPGNFRENVRSKSMWVESLRNLQSLIALKPNIKYRNMSDGAKIEGAEPCRSIETHEGVQGSKSEIMERFEASEVDFCKVAVKASIIVDLDRFRREVADKDLVGIHEELKALHKSSPILWRLIKGTVSTQLVIMAGAASPDRFTNFNTMLAEIQADLEKRIYEWCKWEAEGGVLPEAVDRPTA